VNHLKKNCEIIGEFNEVCDAVLNINRIENLKIVEMSKEVFGIILEYSKKYVLLSNDTIHLATMKRHNIVTNDKDFDWVEWLMVWKPWKLCHLS
jgi:predicted nucleic acid-binding protein